MTDIYRELPSCKASTRRGTVCLTSTRQREKEKELYELQHFRTSANNICEKFTSKKKKIKACDFFFFLQSQFTSGCSLYFGGGSRSTMDYSNFDKFGMTLQFFINEYINFL